MINHEANKLIQANLDVGKEEWGLKQVPHNLPGFTSKSVHKSTPPSPSSSISFFCLS